MWIWCWVASVLAASPQQVVAIGDGIVAAPPVAEQGAPRTVVGGWVPSLADCLEERAPGRFSVADRGVRGDTVAAARRRVGPIRELRPSWVVVTLGAQEIKDPSASAESLSDGLEGLVGDLRGRKGRPHVLLVGMIPPTLEQLQGPSSASQEEIDTRTRAWNAGVSQLAGRLEGVEQVELWADWPHEGKDRGAQTTRAWHLSDQGHARVAAAVCDKILSLSR